MGVLVLFGLIAGGFAYERKLRIDEQSTVTRQTTGLSLLNKADAAQSQGELEQVQLELSAFFPTIKNEHPLASLADSVALKDGSG